MPDGFVPLTSFLRSVNDEPTIPCIPASANGEPEETTAQERAVGAAYDEQLCAARRFRAALADALDVAVERLLREIANAVLARELELSLADIAAVVTAALDRFAGEKVLSLRVHPQELGALAELKLEKISDDALEPGDVVLELRSGTIDLKLAARLEAALASCLR